MRRAGSLVAAVATLAVASTASAAREPAQAEKAAIARAVAAYCASGDAWKPLACGIDWGAYSLDYAPGPPPGDAVPEDVLADFEDLIDP